MTDLLDEQLAALQKTYAGAHLERRPNGSALVTVPAVPLPQGWSSGQAVVRFVVPVGYPMARPDCFWTEATLRLGSGTQPANTQMNANYGGSQPLLWFSYHPRHWDPNADSLVTYVNIIRARFRDVR